MLQNAAIDIAIGLVLMYLVLSLVCTVINEFIATKLDLRSRALAAGLQELLDDPVVRNAFYDHGLIAGTRSALAKVGQVSLMGGAPAAPPGPPQPDAASTAVPAAPAVVPAGTPTPSPTTVGAASPAAPAAATQPGQHPSYVSAETFVLALVGSLTGTRLAQGQQVPGFADVQSAIQNLPPSRIKSALVASLMTSGNFDAFRKSVATWFDDSMDRVGGAYKRHLKLISIVVGCAVAVIVNADTFEVGTALWSDSALRDQMVQAADATVKAGLPTPPSTAQPTSTAPTAPPATAPPTPTDIENAFKVANGKLRPLPVGWPACTISTPAANVTSSSAISARECPQEGGGFAWFWSVKVFGWFATGLALSLGAPFWFDLLSKFINIRGAGVKPQRQT